MWPNIFSFLHSMCFLSVIMHACTFKQVSHTFCLEIRRQLSPVFPFPFWDLGNKCRLVGLLHYKSFYTLNLLLGPFILCVCCVSLCIWYVCDVCVHMCNYECLSNDHEDLRRTSGTCWVTLHFTALRQGL